MGIFIGNTDEVSEAHPSIWHHANPQFAFFRFKYSGGKWSIFTHDQRVALLFRNQLFPPGWRLRSGLLSAVIHQFWQRDLLVLRLIIVYRRVNGLYLLLGSFRFFLFLLRYNLLFPVWLLCNLFNLIWSIWRSRVFLLFARLAGLYLAAEQVFLLPSQWF